MEVLEPLINLVSQITAIAFPVSLTIALIEKFTKYIMNMLIGKEL